MRRCSDRVRPVGRSYALTLAEARTQCGGRGPKICHADCVLVPFCSTGALRNHPSMAMPGRMRITFGKSASSVQPPRGYTALFYHLLWSIVNDKREQIRPGIVTDRIEIEPGPRYVVQIQPCHQHAFRTA